MDNVFIVAELSANHGGEIEIAIETIKAAKRAGADAVKLQTYTPHTITLDCDQTDFKISGGTIWDDKTLFELYNEAYLPWEWHAELFKICADEGLVCFSTPFDKSSVDFLEELNNPIYKIASFEITDIPLIEYVANKGKPIVISTGVAEFEDIQLAINACRKMKNEDITILKCTSSYPAPIEEANMVMMQKIAEDFNVKVGLSDHTLGITLPVVATALGARLIEKHLILNKSIGGPDAVFSIEENEFAEMVKEIRNAEKSLGEISYNLSDSQQNSRQFLRSLYVSSEIKKGSKISELNIKSVRPSFGLHPKFFDDVIGKKATKNLYPGNRLTFEDIE